MTSLRGPRGHLLCGLLQSTLAEMTSTIAGLNLRLQEEITRRASAESINKEREKQLAEAKDMTCMWRDMYKEKEDRSWKAYG